ncbi:MAG: DUF2190 family protein [Propionibacteriaceae bacterium]|nr:DUF2190 family protein [Propionibacteriaceae bacterium]
MPEIYDRGENFPVKVPNDLLATAKKGDPLWIGAAATGYGVVLTTDPKPTSETPSDTIGPKFAGGTKSGYASATTVGIHSFTVGVAINEDDPVYIVIATGALTATAGSNPVFGWARNTKGATSGELLVRIKKQ